MNKIKQLLAISLAAGISTSAAAAEYTLTVATWAPPTHPVNAVMWPNLIKMIEKATDGRVTAKLKFGLAPPPAMMDLVQDGAADMTWIFHGYQAGRFTTTKLIELPGYSGNAEQASVAYWRVYDKHLAKAKEHRGVKVVAMHTHGPAHVHSNKIVKSLADIKGMKLRVPGGVGSDVGKALGAIGIKVPAPKVYETLASKAADGVVMPIEGRKSFKLTEVAKNLFQVPGGLYRGSFATIMNMETFKKFPADIQKALTEKVFGEPASQSAGKMWDGADAAGLAATKAAKGNTMHSPSKADLAAYRELSKAITAKVIKEVAAKGVDAEAATAMIRAEMAR